MLMRPARNAKLIYSKFTLGKCPGSKFSDMFRWGCFAVSKSSVEGQEEILYGVLNICLRVVLSLKLTALVAHAALEACPDWVAKAVTTCCSGSWAHMFILFTGVLSNHERKPKLPQAPWCKTDPLVFLRSSCATALGCCKRKELIEANLKTDLCGGPFLALFSPNVRSPSTLKIDFTWFSFMSIHLIFWVGLQEEFAFPCLQKLVVKEHLNQSVFWQGYSYVEIANHEFIQENQDSDSSTKPCSIFTPRKRVVLRVPFVFTWWIL